jgi:acetyltransferase-like isoleucine patch superfamily enzyme
VISLPQDWFHGGVPDTVRIGADVYLDSSYAFGGMRSTRDPSVILGNASGVYDPSALLVGPDGCLEIGDYSIINSCTIICESSVVIGAHCLLAWGSVIADSWDGGAPLAARRLSMSQRHGEGRWPVAVLKPRPVRIEDHSWIGFGAVVLPGVVVGRGAVVSAKSVVREDIPEYAVAVGDPARVVRFLEPDDHECRHTIDRYRRRPS